MIFSPAGNIWQQLTLTRYSHQQATATSATRRILSRAFPSPTIILLPYIGAQSLPPPQYWNLVPILLAQYQAVHTSTAETSGPTIPRNVEWDVKFKWPIFMLAQHYIFCAPLIHPALPSIFSWWPLRSDLVPDVLKAVVDALELVLDSLGLPKITPIMLSLP